MEDMSEQVPQKGEWPVDPQEDVPIDESRIWIDGCFDFTHHGHAGAILQARRLGQELYVGVHSDQAILENKGPTVMTLDERMTTVEANRWTTKGIPSAPYITYLPWISHYGCKYVVHGDDITSDASGQDCYRFVKAAGRFKVVKRTPGISTTDLVGRMLLYSKAHFVNNVEAVLKGEEGHGSEEERKANGEGLLARLYDYATDETGWGKGCDVWIWQSSTSEPGDLAGPESTTTTTTIKTADGDTKVTHRVHASHSVTQLVAGKGPKPGQRIVYVDGGFDLFSPGHIEFLRMVGEREEAIAAENGWYGEEPTRERIQTNGSDYKPYYVVVGVHDDAVINHWKGLNYPIMNIFERGLCVLQCKYTDMVVFSAPYVPTLPFLSSLPHTRISLKHNFTLPDAVYHGPTTFMETPNIDPYRAAKALGIFIPIAPHKHQDLNAGTIVERILRSRGQYEERQRKKGVKAADERVLEAGEE